jgi:ribosome-associated protein
VRDRAGGGLPEVATMTERIRVSEEIGLDPGELEWRFVRASGPGGQKVNKTATAVQLRFAAASPSLPEEVRIRLLRLAGQRATRDGVVVIDARRFRTQARNRRDALERLVALVRAAAAPRPRRRPSEPPQAARRRRLEAKRRRALLKRQRRVDTLDA